MGMEVFMLLFQVILKVVVIQFGFIDGDDVWMVCQVDQLIECWFGSVFVVWMYVD